jgi:hypothetical protein
MQNLAIAAAALACPVSMSLMMWFMAKAGRRTEHTEAQRELSLDQLRAEHRRLGAQIDGLEDRPPAGTRH